MSDEPLFCRKCGAEDFACDCSPDPMQDFVDGPYCHYCGVIPGAGLECKFYKDGGSDEPCRTVRNHDGWTPGVER